MGFFRGAAPGLTGLAVTALLGSAASAAETTVRITLWDKGPASLDGMGETASMAMGMPTANPSGGMLGIKLDRAEVPAGTVTFEADNTSGDFVHEMIVAPVADASVPMVYDDDEARVDEDEAGALGEVPELEPGQTGSLSLELAPGNYILYCNMPGHIGLGMWTLLKVT